MVTVTLVDAIGTLVTARGLTARWYSGTCLLTSAPAGFWGNSAEDVGDDR